MVGACPPADCHSGGLQRRWVRGHPGLRRVAAELRANELRESRRRGRELPGGHPGLWHLAPALRRGHAARRAARYAITRWDRPGASFPLHGERPALPAGGPGEGVIAGGRAPGARGSDGTWTLPSSGPAWYRRALLPAKPAPLRERRFRKECTRTLLLAIRSGTRHRSDQAQELTVGSGSQCPGVDPVGGGRPPLGRRRARSAASAPSPANPATTRKLLSASGITGTPGIVLGACGPAMGPCGPAMGPCGPPISPDGGGGGNSGGGGGRSGGGGGGRIGDCSS